MARSGWYGQHKRHRLAAIKGKRRKNVDFISASNEVLKLKNLHVIYREGDNCITGSTVAGYMVWKGNRRVAHLFVSQGAALAFLKNMR